MISVEDALQKTLALAKTLAVELVPLARANGRSYTGNVTANRAQPPFDASAMDGYALPLRPAVGDVFRVVGEAGAGHRFEGIVGTGEAVRIFTGAPVPQGAHVVVLQEDVSRSGNDIRIEKTSNNNNIRSKGCDFQIGHGLAPRRLRPNDLALLAAMNIPTVAVVKRPIVAIIATGDELVMPGEDPGPDQIIASNIFALAALAESVGAEVRILPIARDTEASLTTVFDLAKTADLIITIGGASVGDHDLVAKVAGALGMDRAFYKIAMRPGKPLMAGHLHGIPMLGLPGNPVSAIVCAQLFMLPLLRAMQGDENPKPQYKIAQLSEDIAANGPRVHYMRAKLDAGTAIPTIAVFADQDSSLLSVLTRADALLCRPINDRARTAGETVQYLAI